MIKALLAIFLTIFSVNSINAQLSTNSNVTPALLVQNVLLGSGINVSNISYTGSDDAIGSFDGSNCNIGMGSGIIMTTGTVKNSTGLLGSQQGPFGPNDESGAGTDNGEAGYGLLDNITTASTQNAAVLEFDFEAVGSNVSFNYVFASEEYLEYVNAGFNDVFGFFISGANPSGGNYTNENIAIIPGTSLPVSIDNLNDQSYSQYYINNGDGNSSPQNSDPTVVQYDGFTTPLTAEAEVVCGEMYHIKIAIADVGDGVWDSGVFLEAQSFTSTPSLSIASQVVSSGNLPPNQILEGCGNGSITFTRFDSINFQQTFSLSYAGSSTNGVDYSTLPDNISYAAGDNAQTINISPIYDEIAEGTETLDISITFAGDCGSSQTETVSVQIVDQQPLQVNMVDEVTVDCPGTPEYLVASSSGGTPEYNYIWSTGETTSFIYATPAVTTTYSVTVSDVCGHQSILDSIKVIVPIYDPLDLTMSNDTSLLCPNTPVDLFSDITGGAGNYSWNWSSGDNTDDVTVETLESNTYVLTVTDMCDNSISDSVDVDIVIPVLTTQTFGATVICPGNSTDIEVIATSGAGYYEYAWNTGETDSEITVNPSQSTTFFVSVSDSCATYDVVDSVRVGISQPNAQFSVSPTDVIVNTEVSLINESVDAVTYYWDFDNGTNSTETNPTTSYTIDGEAEIMLVAANSSGCTDTTYQTIIIHPEMIFFVPNAFTPDGDGVNEFFAGDGVGIKDYRLRIFDRWGQIVFESTSQRLAWDGSKNGIPAPNGIYVWQYKLVGFDETIFKKTGHVSLIR